FTEDVTRVWIKLYPGRTFYLLPFYLILAYPPPLPPEIAQACGATRFPSSCHFTLSQSPDLSPTVQLLSAAVAAPADALHSSRSQAESIHASAAAARHWLKHLSFPALCFKKAMAKSSGENGQAFEFCEVCRLNHDQGRRHKYFPSHARALAAVLARFHGKLSDVRFFLRNPSSLSPEHAVLNRLWCLFCRCDLRELGSSFAW
ncbi:hypothetical protein BHM03_00062898, partial [Ensete ventricosum]